MPARTVPPTLDQLLTHADFVRMLAAELVSDAHLGEDIAQDVYVEALRNPPQRAVRAWLRRVTRSISFNAERRRERRAQREFAAARTESTPSAAAQAARRETLREVTDAVLALEGPYLEVVLQRFYEGLSPSEIACLRGEPVATVKSRLQRALKQLRGRLDRRYGSRDAWPVLLLPLVGTRNPGATAALVSGALVGGMIMKTKLAVAATVVACVAGLLWVVSDDPEPWSETAADDASAMSDDSASSDPARRRYTSRTGSRNADRRDRSNAGGRSPSVAASNGERTSRPLGPAAEARAEYEAQMRESYRGRLLDAAGDPIAAGATIQVRGTTDSVWRHAGSVEGSDGLFTLRGIAPGEYRLRIDPAAEGPWFEPLVSDPVTIEEEVPTDTAQLTVNAGELVRGTVVDDSGRAVADVPVVIRYSVPGSGRGSRRVTTTDSGGRFELGGLPSRTLRIEVEGSSHESGTLPDAKERVTAGDLDVRVTLTQGDVISGHVVDERGDALGTWAGIEIREAEWTGADGPAKHVYRARVDHDGAFRISGVQPGQYRARLTWDGPGHDARRLVGDSIIDTGTSGLRLVAGPGATIRGRVVAENGEPLSGALVGVIGAEIGYLTTHAADDGTWSLTGFRDDEVVRLQSTWTGFAPEFHEDVAAGTDGIEFVLRKALLTEGRVLSDSGEPVANASVMLFTADEQDRYQANTTDDGYFRVTMAPGDYSVMIRNRATNAVHRPEEPLRAGVTDARFTIAE